MNSDRIAMVRAKGTQPPFKVVFHYADGIRDFARLRFWDVAAAEQYGEERLKSPSIVRYRVVPAEMTLMEAHE